MSILIASFPETAHIAKKVSKLIKANFSQISVQDFPDEEYKLALKKNPKNKTVIIFNSITNDPDNKLIETILAGGIARDYGAKKVILLATYFPYMRQDKHFINYDSFSSKYVIRLFSNFDKLILVDPHLHRIKDIKELSSRAETLSLNNLIAEYIRKRFKKDFLIVGPDEESVQWSGEIAKILKKKVVILSKIRLSPTNIRQKRVNLNKSKNIIVIDDIISTGKTISNTLKMAKSQGAKNLVCIGIHGVLVNKADKLITKNAELITTNTIPNKYSKIDISKLIADKLREFK